MTKQQRMVMIKRRRRFKLIIIALITSIAVCLLTSFLGQDSKVSGTDTSNSYIEYTVSSGDTLWGIAKHYTSNSYDVRITIREIRELNGLTDATIYSGDVLFIPTKYCED